ncbi:hypothetical protein Catovirus_2_308 [Catovirus CTV1]|uniref:Uncharacterized protein n=1 Tax=Catovirus CTV1 TaxID=1977631 RepID=A0A1V0SCC2_9VIRU|nr:hypothetical protein Catovirus_2_308 [Catovirus CTV1]
MSRVNFGHSSRLIYDEDAYKDRLSESTAPADYRLDRNNVYNCQQCFSSFGPRTAVMGNSVSTTVGFPPATALELTDVSSILSNRNMKLSKSKNSEVNSVDVTKFKLEHMRSCNNFLNPSSSRLTNPSQNYRDLATNRFYDLERNPQEAIFWDFSVNSKLEAKDNFCEEPVYQWKTDDYPNGSNIRVNNVYNIPVGAYCNPRF